MLALLLSLCTRGVNYMCEMFMKLAEGLDGGQPEQPGGPEGLQHPDRRSHCHGENHFNK